MSAKNKKTILLLLVAAVLLAVVPFFAKKGAEFGGSDDAGSALQMQAAILLPPLRPLATIYGTSACMISSFDCTTLTKPTGTPITSSGFNFFSSISS